MSPGSETLLVDSPLRLKRLFNVGGFNSTASIISGIIGAEFERFMTLVDRSATAVGVGDEGRTAGQRANSYERGVEMLCSEREQLCV